MWTRMSSWSWPASRRRGLALAWLLPSSDQLQPARQSGGATGGAEQEEGGATWSDAALAQLRPVGPALRGQHGAAGAWATSLPWPASRSRGLALAWPRLRPGSGAANAQAPGYDAVRSAAGRRERKVRPWRRLGGAKKWRSDDWGIYTAPARVRGHGWLDASASVPRTRGGHREACPRGQGRGAGKGALAAVPWGPASPVLGFGRESAGGRARGAARGPCVVVACWAGGRVRPSWA